MNAIILKLTRDPTLSALTGKTAREPYPAAASLGKGALEMTPRGVGAAL